MTPAEKFNPASNWALGLINKVQQWNPRGQRLMPRGGIQVGLVEGGWLHSYFPPLAVFKEIHNIDELSEIETHFKITLPEEFRTFYLTTNGISLFHGEITIAGWKNKRTALFNKTALSGHEVWKNRLDDKLPEQWIFGSASYYQNAGGYVYLDLETGMIHRSEHRHTTKALHSWSSFKEMLLSEYDRMNALYDRETGKRLEIQPQLPKDWETAYDIKFSFPASEAELEEMYKTPSIFNTYASHMISYGTDEQQEAFDNWLSNKRNSTGEA